MYRGVLLEGAFVLTMDAAETAGWLSLAVQGAEIAAIGEPDRLRREFPGLERIDCSGSLLMPGLVNAHLHPELQLLKGALEELDLHAWADAAHFDRALVLLSSPEGRRLQRAGIRAALADCLLGGTTRIATYGVTTGSDEVAITILQEFGLRGHVAVRDIDFEPVAPGDTPRIFRLHAEEALTEAELAAAVRAHARGERLVMHAAETEDRIRWVRERFGTSTVRLLEQHGLLSPRMLLSHAIYLDAEERELLARRGAAVISSPVAETKLSDGIAPIVDYVELGVTVALGTDCAVCNNSNDLFLEMRQLGLVQKLRYGADAMPAEQILRMATHGGARALTGASDGGALVVGGAADLILIDLSNPRLQPLVHREEFSNLAANLVYAATGQDVTDVMIAGDWVVRRGRLLCADQEDIWAELARAANELYDRLL
jgi:5-methylthioadenosine/S-adenosylhomocysteine deaminase